MIVAGMWDRVEVVVGDVDPAAPPTQADLGAIADGLVAANCGVRPVGRTVEELTIPAFVVDDPGPTCEELHEDGWRRYVRR